MRPIIALTAGDVAGIGPEILVRALQSDVVHQRCRPLLLCHPEVLQRAAELAGCAGIEFIFLEDLPPNRAELTACLDRLPTPAGKFILCFNPAGNAAASAPPRAVSGAAGEAAFQYLTTAIRLALARTVDAIATAPLNKAALHAAGHPYPGHTEILAAQCQVTEFGMMLYLPESRLAPLRALVGTLAGSPGKMPGGRSDSAIALAESSDDPPHDPPESPDGLSVVHVTLHTSVQSVPDLLTTKAVVEKIQLMHDFLEKIGCHRNAIGVCALNPHGGEEGLFGDEEKRIIEPAVELGQRAGVRVTGPLPVDSLIRRAVAGEFDGVVAMYHDQGHIPVKLIGFDAAVNITLGLPIVRTSPTHGTAFDRAWNPDTPADPSGMIEAILTAARLCQ
ncbi:MAG: 4-hydroxythreonine-4-phosphate dehydrogenase PdxA [Fuerstiella sp.]